MRFGVNYTPPAGWFHSWLDFSPSDVRRDFEAIAGLGVDHVRIFPLWPIVQPDRGLIRPRAIQDVCACVDIAAEYDLSVNVDAIQGHLSSFDFLPAWLHTWHRRNMFTAAEVVASTADYVRALAGALDGRPNLLGITLGNELNQFAAAPHPDPHPVTPEQGHDWLRTMCEAARSATGSMVTHAMYDAGWYDDTQPFGPEHAVAHGDQTIVHSWVFNGTAQRHGGLGKGSVRHAEYLSRLAAAWHRDADRPVWLQEVGAPTNVVDEADAPAFVERTVRNAVTVEGLSGVTWWCSHDVSRTLLDFPVLEYDLGLFTDDNRRKPTGDAFAGLVSGLRDVAGEPSPAALLLDDTAPGYRAASGPGGAFNEAWLARVDRVDGPGPQVVLASLAADEALLAARGITTVHSV